MKNFSKKYSKTVALILITLVSVALLVTAVSMLAEYSDEVADRASTKAQNNTLPAQQNVVSTLADYTAKASSVAAMMTECKDTEDIYSLFLSLAQKTEFRDIYRARYFKDGKIYNEYNEEHTGNDIAFDFYKSTPEKTAFVGTFNDLLGDQDDGTMLFLAFYAPVKDSALADGVAIYYTRNIIDTLLDDVPTAEQKDADFSVLVTDTGEVVYGQKTIESADIVSYLRDRIGTKEPVDAMMTLVREGKNGTISADVRGKDYLISVGADAERMHGLAMVEFYSVDALCSTSFEIVNTIMIIIIMFAVIVLCVIIYLVIRRFLREREFFNLETTDKKLECFNRHGFEKDIALILSRNNNSYFAVIAMNLRHYRHLLESYGDSETSNLLMHLRTTCQKLVGLEESYGHNGEGQFLLLLHAKDREELLERLKMHSYLAAKYKGVNKFDVFLKYGIYEVDTHENVTVTQMIDFANEANNAIVQATAQNAGMQFNFYNDELRKIRQINEDMELRMEGALRDGEFQVFFQPKYNLNIGKQDGAEALVRWYDPKTQQYNRPALFMQLFETNGFIVKLDKYIYTKVCEYISYTIAHGGTVYPVSVNVSRITAVQPDFVDYYWKTKRQYGISDGLLMIEFTESFAYENYTTLRSIVDGLHAKGFKCSIDDFGCGYSSYRILKSLPMDEIKLDKFFLEKSDSAKRDLAIFQSIIRLGKELGMKVTQEGVELKEDVEHLVELGCDVVQGYYYAHPLSLSDYITFVANSRDHNIT